MRSLSSWMFGAALIVGLGHPTEAAPRSLRSSISGGKAVGVVQKGARRLGAGASRVSRAKLLNERVLRNIK